MKNFLVMSICALALITTSAGAQDFVPKHKGLVKVDLKLTNAMPNDNAAIETKYVNDGTMIGGTPINLDIKGLYAKSDNYFTPAIGIEYFVTDNISIEPIFGGAKQESSSIVKVSEFNVPPSLFTAAQLSQTTEFMAYSAIVTAKYHFMPDEKFSPYLGVGVAQYWFDDEKISSGAPIKLENSSGYGLQAGLDYAFAKNWSLNIDAKKMYFDMKSEGKDPFGGTMTGKYKADPLIVSIGAGYRF